MNMKMILSTALLSAATISYASPFTGLFNLVDVQHAVSCKAKDGSTFTLHVTRPSDDGKENAVVVYQARNLHDVIGGIMQEWKVTQYTDLNYAIGIEAELDHTIQHPINRKAKLNGKLSIILNMKDKANTRFAGTGIVQQSYEGEHNDVKFQTSLGGQNMKCKLIKTF